MAITLIICGSIVLIAGIIQFGEIFAEPIKSYFRLQYDKREYQIKTENELLLQDGKNESKRLDNERYALETQRLLSMGKNQ